MQQREIDTLIVGQGLAGSLLAWQLVAAGQSVCVVDDGHESSSSLVAAGLINPLAGMRFNRRREIDHWLQAADRCYAGLSGHFGRAFFHPLPMLRLFRSREQHRFHARRLQDPASCGLLEEAFGADAAPEPVNAPAGGFVQQRTGYVDLPLLLATLRDWLQAQQALCARVLDYDRIEPDRGRVHVDGLTVRRLVFCDGARLRYNPWFRDLPLAPDKGEILNLRVDGWQPRHIINGAHWVLPLADGELRLGATHEHTRLDDRPTQAGARELLDGLEALLPTPHRTQVVQHHAGIRPATTDRNPLIGRHRDHPSLWVFNGFGARGALAIPWYAQCLRDHLIEGTPLPPEADITRVR
jgi:glycine/D-amino acid oxidase-like deaminating enzyme